MARGLNPLVVKLLSVYEITTYKEIVQENPSHSHILSMANNFSVVAQSKINQVIANELNVRVEQVAAAVVLLDEGATVPFIARYRKEVTGNLDDTQLRSLEERLLYLRELQERRDVVLASIEEQGKLTDELRAAIEGAATKQLLEDIYLPYKPKRRTRAQIAREAGLERSPMRSLPTQPWTRSTKRPSTWMINRRRKIVFLIRKRLSKAPAIFYPSVLLKRPNCSPNCAAVCGSRALSRPR